LTTNDTTVTGDNISASENNVYNLTIAGMTANRNFVLPEPSATGKIIRANILDGDADYALIFIGDTGVTINKGSAATEWSRVFIAGESVTFESTSTTNWNVIVDDRIPCKATISRESIQTIGTGSYTKVAVDTAGVDVGDITDISINDRINIRRSGNYFCALGSMMNGIDDGERTAASMYLDGANAFGDQRYSPRSGAGIKNSVSKMLALTAGQYCELWIYHNEGANNDTLTGNNVPFLTIIEQL